MRMGIRKKIYGLLKWLLIRNPLAKDKNAIYKYDIDYDYLPKRLEIYFDIGIKILIVDKQCSGK